MIGAIEEKLNSVNEEELTFVTIYINEELYGINVKNVREVLGMVEVSEVPNSKVFMKGVFNLRGRMIPLIDMRLRFKFEEREYDKLTVIIVAKIGKKLIGMIADSVSDVIAIEKKEIQNTPHFSSNIDIDCIKGICNIDDNTITILNVDKIFTVEELENLE